MESTRINIINNRDILPFENDIYVHHDLKEDSKFMADRIIIVHGDIPIDKENRDGIIDVISSKEYWYNHKAYFLKYLKDYYVTDDFLRQWVKNDSKDYFLQIVQFLSTYKDIVVLDTTDLDEEEKRQDALILIPESITQNQYRALVKNSAYLSSYKSILIQGGKSVEDPDVFFAFSFELPIHENIQGSTFSTFLEDTLEKYQNQGIENKK